MQLNTSLFTANQIDDIMRRFPSFELSYETISHKKVPQQYDVCLAIPQGKKAFLWFTFFRDQNVCLLITLGREKKAEQIEIISRQVSCKLALNTVIYGSLWCPLSTDTLEANPTVFFVVEDMYLSKGIPLARISVSERLGFLYDFLQTSNSLTMDRVRVVLPVMTARYPTDLPDSNEWTEAAPYTIHHLQYRTLTGFSSYLNEKYVDKKRPGIMVARPVSIAPLIIEPDMFQPLPRFDYAKPQYKVPTMFEIKAGLQYDIYHLYAYGKGSNRVYCGIASIPNCKTSSFMNSIFRRIKENSNLDAIEESDDEEDFQDLRLDKYVDLEKSASIECFFNTKFKRWTPIRPGQPHHKIVHISKL